jgi:hypothetical protein
VQWVQVLAQLRVRLAVQRVPWAQRLAADSQAQQVPSVRLLAAVQVQLAGRWPEWLAQVQAAQV